MVPNASIVSYSVLMPSQLDRNLFPLGNFLRKYNMFSKNSSSIKGLCSNLLGNISVILAYPLQLFKFKDPPPYAQGHTIADAIALNTILVADSKIVLIHVHRQCKFFSLLFYLKFLTVEGVTESLIVYCYT